MLKRQLGLGLENTPFYSFIERRNREEKVMVKAKSKKNVYRIERPKSYNLFKTLESDIRPKKDIYLDNRSQYSQCNNILILAFERRLMNIMQYHSRNVGL